MLAQYTQWCYLSQRVMIITDSEGDYGTGCRNISHCQQQQFTTVHPDNHTQPTYEKTPGFKPFTVMIMMEYSENLPL